jgi:adenosylcobyric acid synthase
MTAKTLMIVGTMSSSGKSLLVTALCRIYARLGVKVAPFKAQNMSNNAAVCADGSEIGRAQALQALAAGVEPEVTMNPVLIKPEADSCSQIILMGKPWSHLHARNFYTQKARLWQAIPPALQDLRRRYDLVIIEGAGSPVELNLKQGDIVNMAIAKLAHAPTLLIGDIDRGGIFAQLLGTLWLLEKDERELVKALVVNKFRGDMSLFKDGIQLLEEKAQLPVLGTIPFVKDLNLPDEDAATLDFYTNNANPKNDGNVEIAIIKFPHIANFDDFDALKVEKGLTIRYVSNGIELGYPNAIILPGTKSTLSDLQWLKDTGLAKRITDLARKSISIVGICGGYQMLGQTIEDPQGIESSISKKVEGLGLLPITTQFIGDKASYQVSAQVTAKIGWMKALQGECVSGYEIHHGRTFARNTWLTITERNHSSCNISDGEISADGKIWGSYLHGLFDNDFFRRTWLKSFGWQGVLNSSRALLFQQSLNHLADTVESNINMALLNQIIWK